MTEPAQAKLSLLRRLADRHAPLLGFGMASLVTGLIGLLLFFLPILGIPVSALGLCFGVVAVVGAWFGGGASLRWGLGGTGVCCLALGVNVALDRAPRGYGDAYPVPMPWQLPRDRPYVPPPASDASRCGGKSAEVGLRARPAAPWFVHSPERLTADRDEVIGISTTVPLEHVV